VTDLWGGADRKSAGGSTEPWNPAGRPIVAPSRSGCSAGPGGRVGTGESRGSGGGSGGRLSHARGAPRQRLANAERNPYAFSETMHSMPEWRNGRRGGLKIRCQQWRVGSTPTFGTAGFMWWTSAGPATRVPPAGHLFAKLLANRREKRINRSHRQGPQKRRLYARQVNDVAPARRRHDLADRCPDTAPPATRRR